MQHNTPIDEFVQACRVEIRGEVRADPITCALFATDASNYQITPLAVVAPCDRDDVAAAMALCARFELPVLPRGGGSSLAGQAVGAAVVLDMPKYMHSLMAVDTERRRARVQPGMTLQSLNDRLAAYGLKFGPDPASSVVCTVGGMVGNNSTGTHSILYHMTADQLEAVDLVLADGTPARFAPTPRREIAEQVMRGGLLGAIWQRIPAIVERARAALDARRPDTWRRCGGYNLDRLLDADPINLAELICGSEGTLAAITEVELRLAPLPRATAIVLLAFDEQNAALELVPHMLASDPSAIEHIDRYMMRMQREAGGDYSIAHFIGADDPEALLITEFYGDSPAEVAGKIERLEQILARHARGGRAYRFIDRPAQQMVWQMRKAQSGLMQRQRGEIKPINFIEDVAVPVEQLAAYIRDVTRVAGEAGAPLTIGAHASAGCLHVTPFLNLKQQGDIDKMRWIGAAVADLVLHYKGALSSEHGDGLARSWLNRHVFGDEIYAAFQQVKAVFDPEGRMNPGKIVDSPQIDEFLRYGPRYATIDFHPQFDWSADGGFAGAVEICSGQGYCRKVEGGTMCPSYMVTRDERDSTRGRANALRNALSGRLPHDQLFGDALYGVMDLCVGCKACQSECPSAVDMSRMRSEFLYHYHQRHGLDLRTRAFAYMPALSRAMTRFGFIAWLANRALGIKPLAGLATRTLNLAPGRHLPRFALTRFSRRPLDAGIEGDAVVLYADTWAEHHAPQVAQAAHDVLRAAGYRVIVPPYACCGRTLLSKGLLTDAKAAAERALDRLAPYAEQGLPIVGLEPSCILAFRDEYLALTQHPARERVAQAAVTFEEFVAANAARFQSLLEGAPRRPALLHGHCHQKAQVGTRPAHTALALAGYDVHEVDSGCCGMAGSFGYEAEHGAISRAMAERALLPAVHAASADTVIVAAGTSCRQQIADLAGRAAIHPAEALARRLG
ncbi:MAG: FAD-binding and (Fe-S)-binding domain-containing protein [Roseiflexaceae bacterium]